jgi:hypothetical protein
LSGFVCCALLVLPVAVEGQPQVFAVRFLALLEKNHLFSMRTSGITKGESVNKNRKSISRGIIGTFRSSNVFKGIISRYRAITSALAR